MLFNSPTQTDMINQRISAAASTAMTDKEIVALEVKEFLDPTTTIGKARNLMIIGEHYYRNHTDIQKKERKDSAGNLLKYRTNTKLEHAFYRKMVDQITGYLFSKKPSITPEKDNPALSDALSTVFDKKYWSEFNRAGRSAINQAITWLQPYFTNDGALRFMFIPGYEIIPLWKDAAHTELSGFIRTYEDEEYNGSTKELVRKVQYWTDKGVIYYIYKNGDMIEDVLMREERGDYHFMLNGKGVNWERIPIVPIKYNDIEQPLIDILKSNIDTYNMSASVHADLLADIPHALLLVAGVGGEADKVRHDINAHSVVISTGYGSGNEIKVEYVQPNIETESTETQLTRIRRDIFSFGAGVDGQDDGQANKSGNALMHKRTDLDTVCNLYEVELQNSFEMIMWFVLQYLKNTSKGDYTSETVNFVLNRDIVVQESQVIIDAKNSVGIISKRTITANHPWVDDVDAELKQLESEEADAQAKWEEQQLNAALIGGEPNGENNQN